MQVPVVRDCLCSLATINGPVMVMRIPGQHVLPGQPSTHGPCGLHSVPCIPSRGPVGAATVAMAV